MSDIVSFAGFLKGHNGWVTSIATTHDSPDTVVSGSRGKLHLSLSLSLSLSRSFARSVLTLSAQPTDKTLILWNLAAREEGTLNYGRPQRSLVGYDTLTHTLATLATTCLVPPSLIHSFIHSVVRV